MHSLVGLYWHKPKINIDPFQLIIPTTTTTYILPMDHPRMELSLIEQINYVFSELITEMTPNKFPVSHHFFFFFFARI